MNADASIAWRKGHLLRLISFAIAADAALLALLYVIGYFLLMDRHLPTSRYSYDRTYFESSFRWAPRQSHSKDGGPPYLPWREATGWNELYKPLDKIYFKLFPRSKAEAERLRKLTRE